jgi:hypothetical protein
MPKMDLFSILKWARFQVQAQRVGTGDAQAVGHERRSRRAARGMGHASLAGEVQDILDNQEDGFIAHASDDLDFMAETGLDFGGDLPVQFSGPGFGARAAPGWRFFPAAAQSWACAGRPGAGRTCSVWQFPVWPGWLSGNGQIAFSSRLRWQNTHQAER